MGAWFMNVPPVSVISLVNLKALSLQQASLIRVDISSAATRMCFLYTPSFISENEAASASTREAARAREADGPGCVDAMVGDKRAQAWVGMIRSKKAILGISK